MTKSPMLTPLMVAAVKVRLADPVLVKVAVKELEVDTATAPKASGEGLNATTGTPAEVAT
jgi:hypothetical protein